MSQKTLYYAQLAEDTARRLTGSWERWAGFLATAGRLYKYPYPDQIMIYAQRPDATACASYDVWNDRMNRYVRRGSKGIALLDDAGDRLRLRYVFDLADTGTRQNSRDPWLWTLEDRHRIPVAAMLERRYGTAATDLPQQLADAAGQLADAYWADHRQEIGGILANSMLEEYDELNRGLAFKRAVTASTTFALLSRCGYAPENHFGAETFRNIYEFNTPATVAALGTAVSESSREILLQIAAVVRQVERDIAEERRLWDEQHSIAVHAERGLSGPEHRALNQPEKPLGKYGRMRRTFLKENRPILYNHLLLSGTLYPHLAEIDQAAKQRLEQMMLALTQAAGATEELKARDPMQWTGRMNACKAQAEEVIRNELIFN